MNRNEAAGDRTRTHPGMCTDACTDAPTPPAGRHASGPHVTPPQSTTNLGTEDSCRGSCSQELKLAAGGSSGWQPVRCSTSSAARRLLSVSVLCVCAAVSVSLLCPPLLLSPLFLTCCEFTE